MQLKIGRSSDQGCLALFEPSTGLLGLHQYDGLLQLVSVDPQSGAVSKEIHECKLEQLAVVQLAWLRGQSKPTLLVLAAEHGTPATIGGASGEQRRLRSYTYEARDKELKPAPHAVNLDRCDSGAAQIIATEFGGAIVVAEEVWRQRNKHWFAQSARCVGEPFFCRPLTAAVLPPLRLLLAVPLFSPSRMCPFPASLLCTIR